MLPTGCAGHIAAGGQNHFYMETQCAIASIEDGENYTVTCGTQDPSTYQAKIAAVLGVPQNRVIVKCARTGGGFGGKLTGGITNAAVAALWCGQAGGARCASSTCARQTWSCRVSPCCYLSP